MAFSINQLRNTIRTSIHGRRVGLGQDGALIGVHGVRSPITNCTTSTTATAIPNHGTATVVTTTNTVWTLTDPDNGSEVTIATASTSTGNHAIVPAAATIISTNGTAGSSIIMQGVGAFIKLVGISTSQWVVAARGGSTTAGATVVVTS